MMRKFADLYYLDERPIQEFERTLADAWRRGGEEEEQRAKDKMKEDTEREVKEKSKYFKKVSEDGKAKRKEMFSKMIAATKDRKANEIKQREDIKK